MLACNEIMWFHRDILPGAICLDIIRHLCYGFGHVIAMASLDEARLEAFLDGLTLGRLERQRREEDFPELTEILSLLDGLYEDEDEPV